MSQFTETPVKTLVAGAAIAAYLRVKIVAGVLAVAGLADNDIGTIERQTFASGDLAGVRLRSAQGTCKMVAAGAITAGAAVYTAAAGKVSATAAATAQMRGIALEAATADGDVIEVLQVFEGGGSGTIVLTAGAAIAAGTRVVFSSGKLAAAAITDNDIGVLVDAAAADGSLVRVALRSAQGIVQMIAAGAVTLGAAVYTADDGEVSATGAATSYLRGYAMSAQAEETGGAVNVMQVFVTAAESG